MVVVKPVPSATFQSYQCDFQKALSEEIAVLRKAGGSMTPVTDGHYLGKRSGDHLYSFTTDSEVRFPEDTPIDLHYQKERYPGVLVSVEGFDILITLKQHIGDTVNKAKLNTEPWFLLEALKERLATASVSKTANRQLAETLLNASPRSTPNSTEQFSDYCDRITTETGLALQYNEHQAAAITHVLQHPVSFIWGPAGTGKTSTLGLTVAALVHSGQSVLVLAHSNAAVDTAMKSVGQYLCQSNYYKEGMVLRFGIPANKEVYTQFPKLNVRGIAREKHPELVAHIESLEKRRKQLVQDSRQSEASPLHKQQIEQQISKIREELRPLRQQFRNYESALVSGAEVTGCTLSKASIAKEIYQRQFDVVIVDEASMVYIPHCAYGATLAKKRIAIFGDFRQLAPVSQADSASAQDFLQRDIFDEAGIINSVERTVADERLVLLRTQYRMHPSISAIPNELFYKNRLIDGEGVKERTQEIANSAPSLGKSLVFYDLNWASAFCFHEDRSSRFNLVSALIAADLTYQAQVEGTQSIGVITPYSAQARLIHRILKETGQKEVKAATVHRFQGSEKHVIVFDAVDSYQMKNASKLLVGGAQSTAARLANVAVSRAEGKFIGLFNDEFLKKKLDSFNIFRKFIDRLRFKSEIVPLSFTGVNNTTVWEFSLPHIKAYADAKSAKNDIQADLAAAAEAVAVDWPDQLRATEHFLLKFKPGLKLFARGPKATEIAGRIANQQVWRNTSFSMMGIVGIDGNTLWIYASPRSKTSGPVFRISLPETVKLLYDFLELTPDGRSNTLAGALRQNKNPFGSCEICRQPLWPTSGSYGALKVSCIKHPHQSKNLTPQAATQYAEFMKYTCPHCQAALKAGKSSTTGKVFLRCTRASCRGTVNLSDLI